VACLLHGGFWKTPYGRDQLTPVARDLCDRGLAVWNIGYRRIGEAGVGYDEIASDVLAALDYLQDIHDRVRPLDLGQVAVVGHSAGGQLALACTSMRHTVQPRIRPSRVASLAGLADLEAAFAQGIGGDSVRALLGGSPREVPERYANASPIRLLPHGSRLALVHGVRDEDVPFAQSEAFARAARAAGDDVSLLEISDGGHMDFLDPRSAAHAAVVAMLTGTGARTP
jgi:acetyl esterase/lipase